DAGWTMLKTQLEYKSIATQGVFIEVNEAYSTQACSCCGSVSANSPKGRAGLGIREWGVLTVGQGTIEILTPPKTFSDWDINR
ncbi:MAG: zinc ribbon domain-containing protein, partial [Methylobacter sp.]|nr:zinc ribbon domain-containing protein [Methylobacter sp.]